MVRNNSTTDVADVYVVSFVPAGFTWRIDEANPDITVEVGTEKHKVKARELEGEERERIWTKQKELMPGFADYERKTEGIRDIPVILLEHV